MAENVLKLKKEAIRLGMDKSEARGANRSTLESFIASASKSPAKKKGGTVAKKKATATPKKGKVAAKKNSTTATKSRSKSAPAAKSAKAGKAKRPTAAKNTGNGGRHMIGSLDFSVTDGWNPRDGSPVAVIFKALKKARGDVNKAFEALRPDVRDFVSSKKADGTKRTKDEMLAMLRYRINRTKFQFALQTGQHVSSTDRVEYGTGDYASTRKKGARRAAKTSTKRASTRAKASTRKPNTRSTKKAGRKPAKRR